jgi:hypothetical protein
LPAQVQVRWSDDLPAEVHGRAFAGRITCAATCWMTPCPARRARRSALVHELTHVADRGGAAGRAVRAGATWPDGSASPGISAVATTTSVTAARMSMS